MSRRCSFRASALIADSQCSPADHFDPPYAAIVGQLTHPDASSHSIDSRICSDHLFHLDYSESCAFQSLEAFLTPTPFSSFRGTTVMVEWIALPGECFLTRS